MSNGKRMRPTHKPTQPPVDASTPRMAGPASRPYARMVDAEREPDANTSAFTSVEPRWWGNTGEWLRGKTELAWETRIVPAFAWIGAIFARLGNRWGRGVRIPERHMRRTGPLRVWSWDEQGVRMLKRTTRMLMVVAVGAATIVIFIAAVTRIAAAVAGTHANLPISLNAPTATPDGGLTILNGTGSDAGTPIGIPDYTLGLWMSNSTPGVGEATTVYAKVTHLSAPVKGINVTFTVGGEPKVVATNADGIASLRVFSGGPGTVPVEIDGAVSIGGQNLTGNTFFTPI